MEWYLILLAFACGFLGDVLMIFYSVQSYKENGFLAGICRALATLSMAGVVLLYLANLWYLLPILAGVFLRPLLWNEIWMKSRTAEVAALVKDNELLRNKLARYEEGKRLTFSLEATGDGKWQEVKAKEDPQSSVNDKEETQ